MTTRPWSDPSGRSYDELVGAALAAPFSGWDFSYLTGRVREAVLPWSYEELARDEIGTGTRLLDLDTGGGELFTALVAERSPAVAVATESWGPNVDTARQRLESVGAELRPTGSGGALPAADGEFTLVLNRHGACEPAEVYRVLAPGGVYLTQGVGARNDVELNEALDGPQPRFSERDLAHDTEQLVDPGFMITDAEETSAEYGFRDIGAVVYHLRAVSWQIPGFDVERYDTRLRELDSHIRRHGEFVVRHHRYLLRATRP